MGVRKAGTGTISDIAVKPKPLDVNDPTGPSSIGVNLGPNLTGFQYLKAESLPDAIIKSATEVKDLSSQVAKSLLTAIGGLLSGSQSGNASISGPIGVIKAGSNVVSKQDINALIGFVAIISVNLAVINSLPFPGLDGGQLFFLILERASGGRFDQLKQESVN